MYFFLIVANNFLSLATCRKCGLYIKQSSAITIKLADMSLVKTCGQV